MKVYLHVLPAAALAVFFLAPLVVSNDARAQTASLKTPLIEAFHSLHLN